MESQELSILQDLINELLQSQMCHIYMRSIRSDSGEVSVQNTLNKLERKEETCAFIEIGC